eukprot:GHVN01016797.1.p1 GENE.GHVN01016797.1~~GHVN01016797.1.p1  ORF type:complete len:663 (+),score=232.18 GHVN01016797.1:143-2131(+)
MSEVREEGEGSEVSDDPVMNSDDEDDEDDKIYIEDAAFDSDADLMEEDDEVDFAVPPLTSDSTDSRPAPIDARRSKNQDPSLIAILHGAKQSVVSVDALIVMTDATPPPTQSGSPRPTDSTDSHPTPHTSPHIDSTESLIIASGSCDERCRVYRLKVGDVMKPTSDESGVSKVNELSEVSEVGKMNAIASPDVALLRRKCDIKFGSSQDVGFTDTVSEVTFSWDGKYLAASCFDGSIGVFEWSKQPVCEVVKGSKDKVSEVVKGSEGKVTDLDEMMIDVKDENESTIMGYNLLHHLTGPGGDLEWCKFHPKGYALLAGCGDSTLWLWWAPNGHVMRIFSGHHTQSVTAGGFLNDPVKLIYSGASDGTVGLWSPFAERCLARIDLSEVIKALLGTQTEEALSALREVDSLEGVGVDDDDEKEGFVKLGSLDGSAHKAIGPGVSSMAAHGSGTLLAVGTLAGFIYLFAVQGLKTGKRSSEMGEVSEVSEEITPPSAKAIGVLKGHSDSVEAMVFSGDEGGVSGTKVSEVSKLSEVEEVNKVSEVSLVKSCLEGEGPLILVTGALDGKLIVWDCRQSYSLMTIPVLNSSAGGVTSLCRHPLTSVKVVCGDSEGGLRVYDTRTGKVTQTLTGHSTAVVCVRAMRVGQGACAVSGSDDNTARLWRLS